MLIFHHYGRLQQLALLVGLAGFSLATDPAQAAGEEFLAEGRALYQQHCAGCHGADLRGSAHGTALVGEAFLSKWPKSSALLAYTRANMPPGSSNPLRSADYGAILAFVDQANQGALSGGGTEGDASGKWESWSEAGSIDEVARSRGGFVNRRIPPLPPVTDAMLAEPDKADWLSWRRTLDGQGYSPLDSVNRGNVHGLRLAWVLAMQDGSNQGTPLVYKGIMFLTHPGNVLQAVDAASGDVIWEYRYQFPQASRTLGGPTRNIALYGDKLFLATYDAAVVAVDVHTGEQVWRTGKADFRQGYTHTSGPLIADGVVISGINGCERYTGNGCFITGHDPDTGRELWRTSTIAQPGEPGGDTWGGLPVGLRAGSDTWIAGSYDPESKLFFIGTSQAKPWVAASRGMTTGDAALYTNSTLALEPRTGRIVWHYQHVAGETIDMEVGFERVLVDLNGTPALLTVGKDGILWKLDRRTGRFLAMVETMPQTIFESVDRERGEVGYRADIRSAGLNEPISACPGIYGGHNWQASGYSPEAGALIIPLHQLCSELLGRPVEMKEGGGGYGGESHTYPMPGVDGKLGRLAAFDVDAMEELWAHQQAAMFLTGVLTTAGGLAFVGDLDRYFKAFDVDSGELLWQVRLGAPLHGFPISFAVEGRQYIAVQTGIGVFRALTAQVSPEIYQPVTGQAIYVFELPGEADGPGAGQ